LLVSAFLRLYVIKMQIFKLNARSVASHRQMQYQERHTVKCSTKSVHTVKCSTKSVHISCNINKYPVRFFPL